MTTKPVPTRRWPTLGTTLLSPVRAIERARGRRRIGLLTLYGLVALLIWAMLWRQSQLRGLPDIGEPFDAAASRNLDRVPEDHNAFVPYRRAAERFRDLSKSERESFTNANLRWSRADATLRGWVAEHREAISLLRDGSERPEAYLEARKRPAGTLTTAEKLELRRRLAWIGDAALFEAGRLRAEGDRVGAWSLLKAVVRASRHMERAVPIPQDRHTSVILIQFAHDPVAEWAEDPAVDVALLRRALDDLAAAEALTPPLSLFYRGGYLAAEESLGDLQPLIAEWARLGSGTGPSELPALTPDVEAFLRREPERSRRVLRLLIANDLAWCDRPVSERPALAVPRLRIYEPDSAAQPLPPEELARWADSALIIPSLSWRLGELEQWDRADRWSIGQLKEAIAVPLFTREMGRPPASEAEALRRYFPPTDGAPDRDEAEPVPGTS